MSDRKHGKPMEISDKALELMRGKTTETPGILTFPHHSGSAIIKPDDKGKLKGRAVAAMHEQSSTQFKQIEEQIQLLVKQAQDIKDRIEISERIYLADMGFDPLIGKTYFLYRKKDGSDMLSMVAPTQWGCSFPFETYLATVKLLSDHTWNVEETGEEGLNRY
ncbi:MAG: DUF2452 domain-containing protein [Cyclobacteriaceae bacterium]